MVRLLFCIACFLLVTPYRVRGQACPSGDNVVHVCQPESKEGTSIQVDGSKAKGFHGQCVCEVHAVGGAVVVKMSAPVVPAAQCGALVYSIETGFTAHCGNPVPTVSGSIGTEQNAFLTIATEKEDANSAYCVKVEKESGDGQVRVTCTEIAHADRANKATTTTLAATTSISGEDIASTSVGDTTSSSGEDTTSYSGGDTTSSSGGDTTSSSGGDTTSSPRGDTTSSSGGDTTSSSGGDTTSSSGGDTTSSSGEDTTSSSEGETTSISGGDTTSSSGVDTTSSSGGDTTSSSGGNTTSSSGGDTTSSSGGDTTSDSGGDTTSSSGGDTTSTSGEDTTSSSGGETTSKSGVDTTSSSGGNITSSPGGSGNGTTPSSKPSGNCSDAGGSSANCTENASKQTDIASTLKNLEGPIVLGALGGIIALLVLLGVFVYLRDRSRARKIAETARQNRIRHSYERM